MRPVTNPFSPHENNIANPRMLQHQQLPQKILMEEELDHESTSSNNKSSLSIDQRERSNSNVSPRTILTMCDEFQHEHAECLQNTCRSSPPCATFMRLSMANPLETALGEERGLDCSRNYLEQVRSSASRRRDTVERESPIALIPLERRASSRQTKHQKIPLHIESNNTYQSTGSPQKESHSTPLAVKKQKVNSMVCNRFFAS